MYTTLTRTAAVVDPAMADYLRFHGPRFEYLLRLLEDYVRRESRVLDIGMSRLTEMIHERFGCMVDAMGFGDDRAIEFGDYYHFDLNDCQFAGRCRRRIVQLADQQPVRLIALLAVFDQFLFEIRPRNSTARADEQI